MKRAARAGYHRRCCPGYASSSPVSMRAEDLDGLSLPGYQLHPLNGELKGHSGVSPEMAVRLSKAFGSTTRHWMQLQMNYDLWHAEQRSADLKIKRLVSA